MTFLTEWEKIVPNNKLNRITREMDVEKERANEQTNKRDFAKIKRRLSNIGLHSELKF